MSERKVATDALESLGKIHTRVEKRDAIHLAVDPVICAEEFAPGAHIQVRGGYAYPAPVGKGHGIVDPFLQQNAKKGDRVWFVMYPGHVASLRHVWSHPAFPDEVQA